jgi:uncharacterized protein YraI
MEVKLKKFLGVAAALAAFAAFPAHADSTTVWFVPGPVDLRAGPDNTFPVVATIPAQAHMDLEGCLSGWTWCDVSWNGQRGWVSGHDIESIYQNKTSYVTELGPTVNVPVVTYNTSTYWDTYYKTQPFYTKREEFVKWEPAPSVPPPSEPPAQSSATTP